MNAMNPLFGGLSMPGRGTGPTPPTDAALPALAPADDGWDEPWDDDPDVYVPTDAERAEAEAWENRRHEAAELVARAQADAAAAPAPEEAESAQASYSSGSETGGTLGSNEALAALREKLTNN